MPRGTFMLISCLVLTLVMCGVGQPAAAQDNTADSDGYDILKTKRLFGDWGGVRTDLEDKGITLKIKLMNEVMWNMKGGLETHNGHDFGGTYELNFFFDMEKLGLVDGATFWLRGKGTWGGESHDFDKEKVGALFKTNGDPSTEEPIFVDKWAWIQKCGDRFEFRIGRIQPHKDYIDASKVIGSEDNYFLNIALVQNNTIPTNKGLGIYGKAKLTNEAYIAVAAIDAYSLPRHTNHHTAFHDAAHFIVFGEIGYDPKLDSTNGKMKGHWRIGTWYDPRQKTEFWDGFGFRNAPDVEWGDWGFFAGVDQMVWKENNEEKDKQGLTVAARYGYAHGEVNKLEHQWTVAARYTGPIPGRDKDDLAFGISQGILADEYAWVHADADRETVYELYYAIQATPWMVVTPDLQYITNTSGDKHDGDTAVAGLRFKMSL